jgi:hypothetical protein
VTLTHGAVSVNRSVKNQKAEVTISGVTLSLPKPPVQSLDHAHRHFRPSIQRQSALANVHEFRTNVACSSVSNIFRANLPYKTGEKEPSAALWSNVQTQLSMELGRVSLSPLTYNYMGEWLGKPHHHYGNWTIDHVCQTWFLQIFDGSIAADQFIKERMSFIELAREHDQNHFRR